MKIIICSFLFIAIVKGTEKCPPGVQVVTAPDGCNSCTCAPDGTIAGCTEMACPPAGPKKCPPGATSVPSEDGCNTCSCAPDGTISGCTEMACVPKEKVQKRETAPHIYELDDETVIGMSVSSGHSWCPPGTAVRAPDGCNVCFCSEDGKFGGCTVMGCNPNLASALP